MINCVICDRPLSGGIDTFGDIDAPCCQTDFFELTQEESFPSIGDQVKGDLKDVERELRKCRNQIDSIEDDISELERGLDELRDDETKLNEEYMRLLKLVDSRKPETRLV